MVTEMLVQCNLEIELFEGNAAVSYSKSFVDEFDSKDWSWAFEWARLLDADPELADENNSDAAGLAMHMLLGQWSLK